MTTETMPTLIRPYWAPPDGSANSIIELTEQIVTDPRFAALTRNIPDAEVALLQSVSDYDADRLRGAIVINRVHNRICNHCYDKRAPQQLDACGGCHLTFYCSAQCQLADWNGEPDKNGRPRQKHSAWCRMPGAQCDAGPLRSAIVKKK